MVPMTPLFLTGQCLGAVAYGIMRKRRCIAVRNIVRSLGVAEPEAQRLARRHFVSLGANLLAMLKIPTMSDAQIWRRVTLTVAPEVPRETDGKGWIAAFSHMSNWELLGRLPGIVPQYRFGAITQKLANDAVNRDFNASRAKRGVTLFDRKEDFWKAVAFLESGGVLGVLTDQYAGSSGTWMPFFGRLTSTSTLAGALAHRVGVDIVPIVVTTTGRARWQVSVGHPLQRTISPELATAAINDELERAISASPADWLWSHDRWKTPKFGFLLAASKRRIFFPPASDRGRMVPYRILVRSVDDPAEAELTLPAVRAIKAGRPDAHVTILCGEWLLPFWKAVVEVDDIISFNPLEKPSGIAQKILSKGIFDVGILLPPCSRADKEMRLAGVPRRLGSPGRVGGNDWGNAPGLKDPELVGAERYRRIAATAGAAI